MTSDAASSSPTVRDRFAEHLRGFDAIGLMGFAAVALGILVAPPIGAVIVLIWAWLSRTKLRDLGLVRPRSWLGGLALGLVLGVALKVAMKAVVMPLFGAPAMNLSFQYVAHDNAAALDLATYAIYGTGFAEELVFRGFLFERMRKLFGESAAATLATLLIATSIFAVAHWQQGVYGVLNAFITGLVLGAVYLAVGRRLYVPMIMHTAFDLAALTMIYFGYEIRFSHLVFQ
jgi:membrane protease YdiL (CAAX protease family)